MAGRRPKPTAMHILNGNPSMFSKAELKNVGEPQPEQVAPEQPRGLSKAARREWRRIVPELLAVGVLSKIDGKALAAYCESYALWEIAVKDYQKHGIIFTTHFLTRDNPEPIVGDRKTNPAVTIANNALKTMKAFLIEFGLTPASRRNLKLNKKDSGDPMEAFLSRTRKDRPAPVLVPDKIDEES